MKKGIKERNREARRGNNCERRGKERRKREGTGNYKKVRREKWDKEQRKKKTSQWLWLISDMSSPGWHCKSIVKAFIRCLEEHRAHSLPLSLSSRFMLHTVRGRGSISSSLCLYKSEQVRTLRHTVGVIITLEDYNDTPPWTRSPVSVVIKQLLFVV